MTGIPNTLRPFINAFIIKFVTKKKRVKAQLEGLKGKEMALIFINEVITYFSLIIQLQDYDSNQMDRSLERLTLDFSLENVEARMNWDDIFQVVKEKDYQPRILYPAKLPFKNEEGIKIFPDKQKICHQETCPTRNIKKSFKLK